MFESVDTHTYTQTHTLTDRRRLDRYTISSPCEPLAQVSLKKKKVNQVINTLDTICNSNIMTLA